MNARQFLVLGASMVAAALASGAVVTQADEQYVQVAEIEVDPVQIDAYRAAVQEQIDAAIRNEPGVLVLYAVSEKHNPKMTINEEKYERIIILSAIDFHFAIIPLYSS